MHSILRGALSAVAAAGLVLGGSAVLSASAAPQPIGSARQVLAGPDTVNSAAVINGSLGESDMYAPFVASMRTVFNDGVDSSAKIKAGVIDYSDLNTALQAKVDEAGPKGDTGAAGAKGDQGDPASDVKGSVVTKTFDPKLIQYIGGPYFDPARGFTTIGTFTLPAGTWVINTSAKFTRTVAGVEGVRPQVGLRIGQGTASPNWGTDLGTVGGEDISKAANKDLWGQAVQSITLTEETTVGVYGHGFTDTTGTEGSNEISAAVQVFAQRG